MQAEIVILRGYVGSTAYGTSLPDSDLDEMIVSIGEPTTYLGIDFFGQQGTRQYKVNDNYERTAYEFLKYVRLATSFNPNIIPLLYLSKYEEVHPIGQSLIDNRKLFNSQQAARSFSGMAYHQITKMVNNDTTGEMGAKRKAIREQYGYDTKHGMHAIRLQRTLLEYLQSGGEVINIDRTHIDRQDLLDIRLGKYKLSEVQKMSQELEMLIRKEIAKNELPEFVDRDAVNDFCVTTLKRALGCAK